MTDPLYLFVFLGLFSPGPNVILLTTSGARFGVWRTMPHLLGVALGVGIIAGLTGLGLGALLLAAPQFTLALKIIASLWILRMAWMLWGADPSEQRSKSRPMTFAEAVLFQWVNPKIWAVALAAVSGYGAGLSPWGEALRAGIAFSCINLFVCLFWTCAGAVLTLLLTTPLAWSVFAKVMALALAAFAIMVFA